MIAKVVKMQKGMEEMTNEELFVLYQESRDQGIKQELTLRYLYLAKSVAIQMNNLYSDFMQMEDILQNPRQRNRFWYTESHLASVYRKNPFLQLQNHIYLP